jgi:pimeloyl-ACP methyl ester carboxylesterase
VAPVRRTLATAGVTFLVLLLIAATYQGVATALERRRFPHPGRLLDVGGHQLHLYCTGSGTPTVILEAPEVTMSAAWALVQTSIDRVTRTCSYDRAGLGWSEAGDKPFMPDEATPQLRALMAKAQEHGPFIVAGAELGAALARLYASRYHDDTAALVMVNVPGAGGVRLQSDLPSPSRRFMALAPWLARMGMLRAAHTWSASVRGLPDPAAGALRSFLNRPDHLSRASSELARWDDVVSRSEAAPLPRNLPVVQVEVEGRDRIALLGNQRNAADVSDAIVRAVQRARSTVHPN